MKITYCIGVHNEGPAYLKPLFDRVLKFKDAEDEVIVVEDNSTDTDTFNTLEQYSDKITLYTKSFENDFSLRKNYFSEVVSKDTDFIFNIDADELPHEVLISSIKEIIHNNPDVDLYYIPRVNIVKGLTEQDIQDFNWSVSKEGLINWPDQQGRVYRNNKDIKWEGKVHEKIVGTNYHTTLPFEDAEGKPFTQYALIHIKDRDRQIQQNDNYSKMYNYGI